MSLASTDPGLVTKTTGYRRSLQIFSEEGTVDAYLRFEAALAEAEGALGVIPKEAVEPILRHCHIEAIDLDSLRQGSAVVGYPIVSLVAQLGEKVGVHGQWVHYGATTQDAMDTAQVLQLVEATDAILADLGPVKQMMTVLADTYRATPMPGRTKIQHGVPLSFGYKVAVWLDQIERSGQMLRRARHEAAVLQFGGAVGTLASLGGDGPAVRSALARRLGLACPEISWHVSRDRMAQLAGALAIQAAAFGKMAMDIALMMSTEVRELLEPAVDGRGSSSTMPQKRNPVICEAIIESARSIQHVPGVLLDAMLQEYERGIGHGYRERVVLCEAVAHLAGIVSLSSDLLSGLGVNVDQMKNNLFLTHGLIHSEAIMMYLSRQLGRLEAHHILQKVARRIEASGEDIGFVLEEESGITFPVALLEATGSIDSADHMITAVLDKVKLSQD
ncbi:adenylosuccinate lyase family protein [uncultured Cohaesibacter sp.]|uniref:class-II fumarase/aspartase family protein n=1 Tax=uncultured Cohaesibacter sp. TaxID=1002546 RepID=UPI00292E9488|nr:adenylosuccinate lyase family protein [uncultured Cohaesibacter sp.]